MKNELRSSSIISALGAIAVAIMGLLGYLPGMELLGSVRENYIPMAPSTAISFIVLGFVLLILKVKQLSGTKAIIPLIATLFVSLFGILEVAGYFSGIDLNFEDTLIPTAGHLNGVPIARMSPATGAAFFLSGVAAFFLILQRKFPKRNTLIEYVGSGLGILVLLISFVFCLAYLYGTPLLYGQGTTIPMALTTALGFMFLSISILASERDAFPLRLLTGASTRSYLLRFILPLSTLSVILGGVVVLSSGQTSKMNPAFISAALTVLIAMVTGFVATLISRHMGGEIDRSKAAVKQANEALRESEERYRAIAEDMPVLICRFLPSGEITYVNESYCRCFDKTTEELVGQTFLSLIPEADQEAVMAGISTMTVKSPTQSHDHRVIAPNGEFSWQHWTNRALFDAQGKIVAYQSIGEDITERKQAVDALRASEENLRTILNSIGDAVIAANINSKVTLINPIAEKLTGWKFEESEGRQLTEIFNIINAQTRKVAENPVDKVLATGKIIGLANHTVLISRDGTEYQIADSAAPITDANGNISGVVLVFRDVTEEYKIEEELFKARKLKSVGVLAGGIAHDFNNILTVLFGNMELAKLSLPRDHTAYTHIETANQALERATNLTEQFLTFAKGGDPIFETVNMKQVIQDSIAFNLSGSNVKTALSLPDNLWQIKADKGQLSQVIANLAINAKQAMPEGGTLHIDAENIEELKEGTASHLSGVFVKLCMRDEGSGIAGKHLEKIFDPYFSTKQTGSGLGLATVHSIIAKHKGHISVDSKLGIGSTFTIYLPAEKSALRPTTTTYPDMTEKLTHPSRHLLIMDDEESIRDLSAEMLGVYGYTVDSAVDGKEAIEKYISAAKTGYSFDIVIMDLTIPGGMGGKETIKKLLTIDPKAKVIVSSGYSTDPIIANYSDYGFRGRLVKPFKIEDLENELSRVMELG